MKSLQELQEILQQELNGRIPNLPGDLLERAINNPNYAIAFLAKQEAFMDEMKQQLIEKSKPLEKKQEQERSQQLHLSLMLAVGIAMRANLIQFITETLQKNNVNLEDHRSPPAGPPPKPGDEFADFEDDNISQGLKSKFDFELGTAAKFEVKEEPVEVQLEKKLEVETESLVEKLEENHPAQGTELIEAAKNLSSPQAEVEGPAQEEKRKLPEAFSTRPSLRPNPFGDS